MASMLFFLFVPVIRHESTPRCIGTTSNVCMLPPTSYQSITLEYLGYGAAYYVNGTYSLWQRP